MLHRLRERGRTVGARDPRGWPLACRLTPVFLVAALASCASNGGAGLGDIPVFSDVGRGLAQATGDLADGVVRHAHLERLEHPGGIELFLMDDQTVRRHGEEHARTFSDWLNNTDLAPLGASIERFCD